MAEESENGQEKTEQPTPKRLQDAKKKGQIPRSRELTTTLLMLFAALGMLMFGGYMGEGIVGLLEWSFQPGREEIFDPKEPIARVHEALGRGLLIVAPFAGLMMLVALIGPVALGGWTFSAQPMIPKPEKMNPVKGIKRIFGPKALIELAKGVAKILVVGSVAALFFYLFQQELRSLALAPLQSAMAHAIELFFIAFFILAASLIVVVAVDVPYQLWDHQKKLRMTRQEVKDEFKQTEGKPEVKGKIRQLQREAAQRRMMEKVPEADVVVTNPTHYSVALQYDQLKMRAPRVIALGKDQVALRIREIASENGIPLFEAPPLARALYHTTDIDQEIPAGLYMAVAQVLAYIYQLRAARGGQGEAPRRPAPDIPEEFRPYADKGAPDSGASER